MTTVVNHWKNMTYFHKLLLLLMKPLFRSLLDFQVVFIILLECSLIEEVASEAYYNNFNPSNNHTSSINNRRQVSTRKIP